MNGSVRGSSIARTTIAPSGRRRPSQIPRLARSTWRSLEPNGDTSSSESQLQPAATYGGDVYSGKFSAKRLTRRPSAPYNSTADVRRYVASAVRDHTRNARSAVGVSDEEPATKSASDGS